MRKRKDGGILLERDAQCGAAAGEAALYCAEVDVQDFGDLLVAEAFDLAQDDDLAKGFGEGTEGGFDVFAEFGADGAVEGRSVAGGEGVGEAEGLGVVAGLRDEGCVDGEFLAFVAGPPAALVAGLVQGDAIDPGAQAGVAVEGGDVAEDLDEDLLGDVGGVGWVAQAAGDEGVDGVAVLGDEQGKGLLRAGFQVRDEALLVCPDADSARQIAHCRPRFYFATA